MKARERTALVRDILHDTFPLAFAAKGAPKAPLAVGIFEQIARALPDIEPKHLGWALNDYTRGPTYLRNCLEGAARIGLDGQAQGAVTANEAKYAAGRLRAFDHAERERQAHKTKGRKGQSAAPGRVEMAEAAAP